MSDGFNVSKYLNFSNTFPAKENISTSAIDTYREKNNNLNFNDTFPKKILNSNESHVSFARIVVVGENVHYIVNYFIFFFRTQIIL